MNDIHSSMNRYLRFAALLVITAFLNRVKVKAQSESARKEDYFKIMRMPAPEGTILEVGSLCTLPNGNLGVATRQGDIFIVENPTSPRPYFRKFASRLHKVLRLAYKDSALYCAQQGKLTKLVDANIDSKADIYKTVYAWPITSNYHKYSYSPKIASDSSFYVILNTTCPPVWWHMQSLAPWRGQALHIYKNGDIEPQAASFQSPCSISIVDDKLFYTDNQGNQVGSGSVMPVKKGAFMGHPASLVQTRLPNSPLKLTHEQVYAKNPPPKVEFDKDSQELKPENNVKGKIITEYKVKKSIPKLQLPAVQLPHSILGISNAKIVKIPKGSFGPFARQLLVADQGQSMIDRIFIEKIKGEYQDAAQAFRSSFQSGIVRLAQAKDGSLFAGETNRGWGSAGEASEGMQQLVQNRRIPFEMKAIRAMPDRFEVKFTKPVNRKNAKNLAAYHVKSFIYKYQAVYRSPPVNVKNCPVRGIKVSQDRIKARIIVANLRQYYIHTISLKGITDQENSFSLVHPRAYYTLNNIPESKALAMSEVSTRTTAKAATAGASKKGAGISYSTVKPLLVKHTYIACHNADKKQIGPAYSKMAKRNYSIAKILELIKNPQPSNWPGYATPMPPMPQVPKEDATKIAMWINSLKVTKSKAASAAKSAKP